MATVTVTKKQVKIEDENWSQKGNGPIFVDAFDLNDQIAVQLISWTKNTSKLPKFKNGVSYEIEISKLGDRGFGMQYTISLEKEPIQLDPELVEIIQEEKIVAIKEDIRQDTPSITTDINNTSQVVKYEEKNVEIRDIQTNSIEKVAEDWKLYQYVINEIVSETDFHTIQTKEGPKRYMKKSGFRKLGTAFNISNQLISEEYHKDPAYYKLMVRAISDLIGMGEVSAEEVQ